MPVNSIYLLFYTWEQNEILTFESGNTDPVRISASMVRTPHSQTSHGNVTGGGGCHGNVTGEASYPERSRTQSPSYARCDEGLWPNPYSELASDWLVLTPDIVFLPRFYGIRLWIWPISRSFPRIAGSENEIGIWPEPLVAPRVRRALASGYGNDDRPRSWE